MQTATAVTPSQRHLVNRYRQALAAHLLELREGRADRALQLAELAKALHVHPVHLSNTVKAVTGRSTCDWYEHGLLDTAKDLLADDRLSIAQVAARLTYDPSNFTKFFKRYAGQTPKAFRAALIGSAHHSS